MWLLLQVPVGILVGFWIKDPTDDLETVERGTLREPLFVSTGKVAEP